MERRILVQGAMDPRLIIVGTDQPHANVIEAIGQVLRLRRLAGDAAKDTGAVSALYWCLKPPESGKRRVRFI
jgi:hypothetical protein